MPYRLLKNSLRVQNVAQRYDERIDPTGWLMMEKLDGIRVLWDGKGLYTRDMKRVINVPKTISFPQIPFEGELW
jgi:DNA ligase-1